LSLSRGLSDLEALKNYSRHPAVLEKVQTLSEKIVAEELAF
jgi:hypothetical protein